MIISTLRGNLDLTKHIEPQYVNQVLVMGSWCIHRKWLAKIKLDGKSKHLGYHSTEAEAHQVYLEAKAIYHIIKEEI